MKVLGGMPVFRIIATPHMPASQAQSQMHPIITRCQAFLATIRSGLHGFCLIKVLAWLAHVAGVRGLQTWEFGVFRRNGTR
jgi:hypothetical protein